MKLARNARVSLMALVAVVTLTGLATGCDNPAEGKAEAEVTEAKRVETTAADDQQIFAVTDASTVSWVGSKVTGSHDGGFNEFTGEIRWNGSIEESQVVIDIDATSIYSDNDGLTKHLLSDDFFSIETYPTARFESTSIRSTDEGHEVSGNLTLKGVTKNVTFPATIAKDGDSIRAQAEFVIKRFDWNIEYAGKQDDLIRDEVVIRFDLQAAAG